jgi:hypothetical protein
MCMRVILSAITLFLFLKVNGQSETISYNTWTYSSPTCSFGTGTTLNYRVHKTILGQPVKNTSESAVACYSQVITVNNTPTMYADQFAIEYPFKYGYKYKITVTCKTPRTQNPNGKSPWVFVQPTNNTGSVNNCSGPESTSDDRSQYRQAKFESESYETNIFNLTPTQSYSRLEIGAVPYAGDVDSKV